MSTVTVEEIKQYIVIQDDIPITLEITDEIVSIVEIAAQGPEGVAGTSGDKHFEAVLAGETDITITHNLAKFPAISVFDSAGDEVEGDYRHLSINSTQLKFSSGFSGKAIFN